MLLLCPSARYFTLDLRCSLLLQVPAELECRQVFEFIGSVGATLGGGLLVERAGAATFFRILASLHLICGNRVIIFMRTLLFGECRFISRIVKEPRQIVLRAVLSLHKLLLGALVLQGAVWSFFHSGLRF